MLRSIMTMVVRDGREQRFEQVWARSAEQISLFPGQRGQTLVRDVDHRRRYTITADWASAEALHAFERSSVRTSLSAALEPLRDGATKSVAEVLLNVEAQEGANS